MKSIFNSEGDSENPSNPENNDQPDENQAKNPGSEPSSTFDLSGDEELDEVRRALRDKEPDEVSPDLLSEIDDTIQNLEPDTGDISSRIDSLQAETEESGSGDFTNAPPFVMEDLIDFDESNETLAEKLKKGWIQPETLRLIINDSMSDAEISQIASELGVDWHTTPGNNNTEKLEFLIDYFKKITVDQDEFGVTNLRKTQPLGQDAKQNWQESDSRLQALQNSLNIPGSPEFKSRNSIFSKIAEDFNQATPLIKWLTVGLGILAILLIVAISYVYFNGQKASPGPAVPPATPVNPFPQAVQLPGGWTFDLQIGSVLQGSWNPTGAEWLEGTEVCRLISLPWNAQLDAVFQTLKVGDEVSLTMSNNDFLPYKVESTKTINLNELDQLTTRDSPCLIILLTQSDTDARQTIIAIPAYSANSPEGIITITPGSNSATQSP